MAFFKMNNNRFLAKFIFILFFSGFITLHAQPAPKPLYSKVVYFEFNQWDIRPQDEKTLLAVVRAIKAQKEPYYMNITGHTDNVDNDKYNYELGLKRARQVAAFLIKRGADSSKIFFFSKGEKSVKTDNSTDSLRMLNRRVEIQLFKETANTGNMQAIEPDTAKGSFVMKVVMMDSVSKYPIRGQILIINKKLTGPDANSILNDTGGFNLTYNKGDVYEVTFSAKGYRTKNITYTYHNSIVDKHKNIILVVQVGLVKVKVKSKKSFEKIYFYGNEARFLPTSADELRRLLKYAKSEGVNAIEIVGHVNYPYHYNQNDTGMMKHNFVLSYQRAKAVYDYLVENGVSGAIITYKGVGNTEMTFPNTYKEEEMQLNRRVEVLILEEIKE